MIELVANSEAMREAVRLASRVATTDANVLVTGESGAGKDALALHIHRQSKRAAASFVKIDCAALPAELLEAELFGYERGAFTGAAMRSPVARAAQGTARSRRETPHLSTDARRNFARDRERGLTFGRASHGARGCATDALTNVIWTRRCGVARSTGLVYRLNVVRLHVPPFAKPRGCAQAGRGF